MKIGTGGSARSRVAVAIGARVGLDKVLGVVPRVDGLDRLPAGPKIVAFNHLSLIDPFLLAWLLADAGHDDPVILLRGDVPQIPMVTRMLEAGALRIDDDTPDHPQDPTETSHAFGQACKHLAAGGSVLIAPERGISPALELMPLRSGAARLAAATDAALIPVGLFGTNRLYDGDRFRARRGVPVTVACGHPVMTRGSVRAVTKWLHLDMEALYERALDDYPARKDGEAGAGWWPARRGGDAPSLAAVIDARTDGRAVGVEVGDDDAVGAEIWADTVVSDHSRDSAERADDQPLAAMDHDEILEHYPRSYHRNAAQGGGYLRDLKGVLAFDLPGQPTQHHPRMHLDHHADGRLLVHAGDTWVVLADVDLSASPTRVVVYGRVGADHTIATSDGVVTVPAGTLATLLGVPQHAPTPDPIRSWAEVQGPLHRA